MEHDDASRIDRGVTIDCDDSESMRVAGMALNFRELVGWERPTWPGGDMLFGDPC